MAKELNLTEGQYAIMYALEACNGISLSWGISRILKIKVGSWDGIRIHVNGYIHQGAVDILYNEGTDLFDIRLVDLEEKVVKTIDDVYLSDLIDILDRHIERTDDYEERVKADYNLD